MPLSDHEIIEQIRDGEKQLFAHLIRRYKDKGMTLALRMLKNREDAEEALQDAFIRAYNALEKFRGNSKFGTWFYRILYNVCLTRAGRRASAFALTSYDDEDEYAGAAAPEELQVQIEREDLARILKRILDSLPERYSTILTMFYLQELSHDEMCEVTGLPLGTIKVRLFRARALLQDTLTRELSSERELS